MRKAIFWDFDGTLTYPGHLWSGSLLKALGPLAEAYGVGLEDLRPGLRDCFPWNPGGRHDLKGPAFWEYMNARFAEVYAGLGLPLPLARECAARVRDIVLAKESYRVRPEAAGALAVCAYKGWRNYILSNNFPELEEVVKRLGLGQFFSGYVVSALVGANKPDARIFRAAEKTAKFPSLIWLVGDNPIADVQGANNAGWHSAYLAKPGAPHAGAQVTAGSLSQVLRYF